MPFNAVGLCRRAQEEATRASVSFGRVLILRIVVLVIAGSSSSFDDIEGEAALQLHAGGAEDGAKGTRGAALFADHLANVTGSDVEAKDGCFLFCNGFYTDCGGVID
jgi:hypothetical protein